MKQEKKSKLLSWVSFLIGPLFFVAILFFKPFSLDPSALKVLAVAVLMISWWITEALPMPAVAAPAPRLPAAGCPARVAVYRSACSACRQPVHWLALPAQAASAGTHPWPAPCAARRSGICAVSHCRLAPRNGK